MTKPAVLLQPDVVCQGELLAKERKILHTLHLQAVKYHGDKYTLPCPAGFSSVISKSAVAVELVEASAIWATILPAGFPESPRGSGRCAFTEKSYSKILYSQSNSNSNSDSILLCYTLYCTTLYPV